MRRWIAPLGLSMLCACAVSDEPGPREPDEPVLDENDPRWHAEVLAIAATYPSWMRLDDSARWAPTRCRAIPQAARISQARRDTPHARKIYTLFAKDPEAYGATPTDELWTRLVDLQRPAPLESITQVIVKETWQPERMPHEVSDVHNAPDPRSWGPTGLVPVQAGDHLYRAGEQGPLFIMFKPRPSDRPTDAGWIYATVTPDGQTVTGAGRMNSCMACHARHEDRLFGLAQTLGLGDNDGSATTHTVSRSRER